MTRTHCSTLLTLSCAVAISACGGDKANSDTPDVPAAALTQLELTLDVNAIALGGEFVGSVMGQYDDGTSKDLTAEATWTSEDPAVVAPVEGQPGHFVSVAEGSTSIRVEMGTLSATANVTVEPAGRVSLELVPASGEFGFGGYLNVQAIAHNSDGTRDLVTEMVTWSSSRANVAIASATEKGRLVSFGQGTTTITAEIDGLTVSGDYTVTEPRVEYIRITPENVRVTFDNPVQYTATAVFSDHDPEGTSHIEDITDQVTWTSSDETVLVISETGLATAVGDGDVVVTAASQDGASASTIARTVSVACPYPDNPSNGISQGQVAPPLFWLDALDEGGEALDFLFEQAYCNAEQTKSIAFVIGAGWCPYCPDYMNAVNDQIPALTEAGMLVVYVEIETNSGAPANNTQANAIVDRYVLEPNSSIRVGDGVTQGANMPFSAAVRAIPNLFVVRTNDMRVIANGTQTNLQAVANNPDGF